MKTFFALLASALFFQVIGGELLENNDFELGSMSGWYSYLESSSDDIVVSTTDSGTDVRFILHNGGTEKWHVQLRQLITVRAGYHYKMSFGGSGIDADKKVTFGCIHNGSESGDNSGLYTIYLADSVVLPKSGYAQYSKEWDDEDVNDAYTHVYIDGGGDTIDYSIAWVSLFESPIQGYTPVATARQSRCGFFTNGSKRIVVKGAVDSLFQVRDSGGALLFSGKLGAPTLWPPSGETVRIADFSSLKTAFIGALFCNGKKADNGGFTVSSHPLAPVVQATLKSYYYQRASTALTSTCAGTWARAGGHPDTAVTIHSTAGYGSISAPKGWYDAGDYGKYIISSGITVYTLLALYEHFPGYASNLVLTIPESGNIVPDALDEVRWNLEWMLAMQTDNGGVYSKLTSLQFDEFVMPDESTLRRYVFMKTTPATLDFAAVMAMSSRLYRKSDAAFADRCIEAAKKAYAWAVDSPSVKFVQPAACNTGEYGDSVFIDEFFWASAELALATGEAKYNYFSSHPMPASGLPWWGDVSTLGRYTVLTNMQAFPSALVEKCRTQVIAIADTLLARQGSGYGNSMAEQDFYWGSNHVAASQGVLLLYAYYLTQKGTYLAGAQQQIDYLLGKNPLGICFVTGFGGASPKFPHHRISGSDGVSPPVPGFLVGGPNPGGEDQSSCAIDYVDKPATSWLDQECSYSSNEVAINWNAPMVYCTGALEALYGGDTVWGFHPVSTQAAPLQGTSVLQRRMTLCRRGKDLLLGIPPFRTNAANGICRFFNSLGKELVRQPLIADPRDNEKYFEVRVPARCIANGCIIVRAEKGAEAMQRCFVVR
jgi:endoglucanase